MTSTLERVESNSAERPQSAGSASNEAWDSMREHSRPIGSKDNKADLAQLTFDNPYTDCIFGGVDKPQTDREAEDSDQKAKKEDNFLWGSAKTPLDSINPDSIKQGQLGDCYFLSSLASLANENPQAVKDMIKDNGDGTYTVTFPGDPSKPITVDRPTDEEMKKYAHSDDGGWVSVIEKAHRKYTGRETSDEGDDPEVAIKLLSPPGSDTVNDDLAGSILRIGRTTFENVEKDIKNALNDGRLIVADTDDDNWLRNHLGASNNPGSLANNHAFAVVGYDEQTKTVTMQNPWGGEGQDGNFTVSLDEFYNRFTNLQFGTRPA